MTPRRGCLVLLLLMLAAIIMAWLAYRLVAGVLSDKLTVGVPPVVETAPPVAEQAEPSESAADKDGRSSATRSETPRRGGRLRLAGADPTTLDPALVRDVVSAEYLYEIYSGLVTLSPELEVVPDLAESWALSSDGTVYTFTLRSDALFHDGHPVTAADVKYSVERACDPATGSPVAGTYLGDIVGCRRKLAGQADQVEGVRAEHEQVVFTIDAPKAYFLSKLTYPTSFVLDAAKVGGEDWTHHPNGTGPFRLAEYVSREKLVLERSETYYSAPAYLDEVYFDLRPVSATTLYENGELDAVPVGLSDLARVRDPLNPLSYEVLTGPGDLGLSYIGLNTRVAPFDDVHVRRAFNLALDKQRLAEVILQAAVKPAYWILPPGLPGHNPDAGELRYDPREALAELAASRYKADDIPPVVLNSSGSGGSNVTAEAVADMIGDTLGLEIVLEQAPWEMFQQELSDGDYQMFLLGWSADYPDAQDFLDVLFHSESPLNYTGYSNEQVDGLLEQARIERDPARRIELYARAEAIVLDEAPWLPLYSGVETWLVAPQVRGFELSSIVLPRLAKVWLVR